MFSTRLDKQNEDDHVSDECELQIYLKSHRNLSQSNVDIIVFRSQLERQL